MKRVQLLSATVLAVVLTACGGGGGGDDGGGGGGTPTASCQELFSPERVKAGDNCDPKAEAFCPVPNNQVLSPNVVACSGVSVTSQNVTVGDVNSRYLVLRATARSDYDAVYVALHYLGAKVETFSNVIRLAELAKQRRVLVIVPQAPGLLGTNLGARWPTISSGSIDGSIAFLRGVVADVRSRFNVQGLPVYFAGLSNGGVMAFEMACHAPDLAAAVLVTAGDFSQNDLETCTPASPVGTVIIHGTSDPLTFYNGLNALGMVINESIPDIHAHFEAANGCTGSDSSANMAAKADNHVVTIRYSGKCEQDRRNYLVSIDGGGHNWPGGDANDSDLTTVGLLGAHTRNFDATLQGYDLLRQAAGDE